MGTTYTKNEKTLLAHLGNRIKNLRMEAGLLQKKLAFEIELDRVISDLEKESKEFCNYQFIEDFKSINF